MATVAGQRGEEEQRKVVAPDEKSNSLLKSFIVFKCGHNFHTPKDFQAKHPPHQAQLESANVLSIREKKRFRAEVSELPDTIAHPQLTFR